jgi:serine/threonine-protein kinase
MTAGTGMLDPEFLVGASLSDDRFKVVARIGAGSMAVVYRAFDRRLETEVVVKVPKKQKLDDPGLMERFRQEIRLLVLLQHPHIVRIFDAGSVGNVPYVVMQYLSGGCLQDRLTAPGGVRGMPLATLAGWLPQVAQALDFAHSRRIVHRDVKPANILFDETGNACLSDFGLTKILHGEAHPDAMNETAAGFVVGTPNFVAPEIVLGADCDGRADQYSLAITVWNTLTGAPPMQGPTPSATMVNQTRRQLPPLHTVRADAREAMSVAMARALQKSPEKRFASCSEFVTAFLAGLHQKDPNGRAVTPPPVTRSNASDSSARPQSGSTAPPGRQIAAADPGGSPPVRAAVPAFAAPAVVPAAPAAVARAVPAPRGGLQPTRIPCPVCDRPIPLLPAFAGRTGRCKVCTARLRIADDLSRLTVLEEAPAEDSSGSRSGVNSSKSADDLIIGDSVFGMRMSRRAIYGLAVAGLVVLLAGVVGLTLFFSQPEPLKNQINEIRSLEE